MRITGTFSYIDHDLNDETWGLVVKVADAEAVKHASNLLCATVDIYPHQPRGVGDLPCTPENFAHCLARLAHAEDHLAREVRSSQALANQVRDLEGALAATRSDLQTCVKTRDELAQQKNAILVAHASMQGLLDVYRGDANDLREDVKRLRRVLHKHDISADTSGEEFDEPARTQADDDAAQMAQDLADERGRGEEGNALA